MIVFENVIVFNVEVINVKDIKFVCIIYNFYNIDFVYVVCLVVECLKYINNDIKIIFILYDFVYF